MEVPIIHLMLPGPTGLWMAICFGVFMVCVLLLLVESRTRTAPAPRMVNLPPAAPVDKRAMEEVVDKRMKQLDEKLVDIHMRTAAKLEEAAREVEEKMQRQRKEFEDFISDTGLEQRLRQLDEKLIDLHGKASSRIAEITSQLEGTMDEFKEEIVKLLLQRMEDQGEETPPPESEPESPLKL